jgi:excisionase family DNA binding protein
MNDYPRVTSYSPKQVADLLGYKVATIYALLSRKELEAGTIGRNRIISQEQLNDYLHRRNKSNSIIDYTK